MTTSAADPATQTSAREAYGKLPLSFEANQGQTDSQVKFLSRGSGYGLFLSPTEAVFSLSKSSNAASPAKSLASRQPAPGRESTILTSIVRMKLLDANPAPEIEGLDELPGQSNYFIGNDPEKWRTNIPSYAKVKHKDVYPGVDMIYYGDRRQLEYDFVVAPGANPGDVHLSFEGVKNIRIDRQGDLVLRTAGDEIRQHKPVVYQEIDGTKQYVAGRYLLKGSHQVGFEIAEYDKSKPLVIDPILVYSSYLGGTRQDFGHAIGVDDFGNAYVAGETSAIDFPTQNPFQSQIKGNTDAFITKINAAGSAMIYSTYFGGSGNNDRAYAIAVDGIGNAFITGVTSSLDFPTRNPIQSQLSVQFVGGVDAFVAKLNPAGSELIFSTYLGGYSFDFGYGIAIDSAGNVYVTGQGQLPPTIQAFQPNDNGGSDAFIVKLNPEGTQILYSTSVGGKEVEAGLAIAVDASQNAYITGYTESALDFPTRNALQPRFGGGMSDAFVARIPTVPMPFAFPMESFDSENGGSPARPYSNFSNWNVTSGRVNLEPHPFVANNSLVVNFDGYPPQAAAIETKSALALKPLTYRLRFDLSIRTAGHVTVRLGNVFSETFTLDSLGASGLFASVARDIQVPAQTSAKLSFEYDGGNGSGVWIDNVSVFERSGSEYVTFLGGRGDENRIVGQLSGGIKVDSAGNTYLTGWTDSPDFPKANATQFALGGGRDAFVAKLNSAGSALVYSTFYGGAADDFGNDLGIDADGEAFVVGQTKSSNFPTLNAIQSAFGGDTQVYGDAFALKLSSTGGDVVYSTYLGGSGPDMAEGVAVDSTGSAFVTGMSSLDFPTVNPFQSRRAATFVAKIFDSSRLSVAATTPKSGGNIGEVSVAVLGGRFQTGATVKLKAANQPDIGGANTVVVNSSRITATFDLRGASPGPRDVIVALADGSTATLLEGFKIEQGGGPQIWVDLIGPRVIRNGREQTFHLTYGNRGNVDSSNASLWISFPRTLTWKLDPNVSSFGKYETATEITLAMNIGSISAGNSSGIPIRLTNSSNVLFRIKAWWGNSPVPLLSLPNGNGKPDSNSNAASLKRPEQNPVIPSLLDCLNVNQQTCPDPRLPGKVCDPHCVECFREQGEGFLRVFRAFDYFLPANHLEHFLSNSAQPINWGSQSGAAKIMKANSFFKSQHNDTVKFWQSRALAEARALGIGTTKTVDLLGTSLSDFPFYPFFVRSPVGNLILENVAHNDGEIAYSFGTMKSVTDSLQGSVYRQRDGIPGCETVGFSGRITYQMNDRYFFPMYDGRPYDYEGAYLELCEATKSFPTSLAVEMPFSYFESACAPPPCNGCTTTTIDVNSVTSIDPNEKIGADGIGTAQFISGEEPLRYVIDFENKATATAAAQEVIVTDQLDLSKFDPNTFSFGPITIGNHSVMPPPGVTQFTADVDLSLPSHLLVRMDARLDKNTGLLMWTFTSIDPNTGEPPPDPTAGFLPPGVGGSVLFTAMPKSSVATATVIKNKAAIVFDANSPLVTQEWSNTIDNSKPASHVLTLPATQNSASFNVQWSGTDTGSGIGDYTIYVSDNGGPFMPWLTQTTATQATFASSANHTYSFFSLARDLTGNIEGTKTTAEATTQIVSVAGIGSQVTDPFGNGINNVTITLSGARSATSQTDVTGASTFADLPTGSYTITPSKTNYSFLPLSKTFGSLSTNQTADFIARVTSGPPILISEETSTRAIALDSVVWLRDPFQLNSPVPWGADKRTRVMLFIMNFDFQAGEDSSIVRADAEDASHRLYPLTVEYVGRTPGSFWLNSVVIRLNDDMGDLGDVLIRVSVRGVPSNRVRLGIGHKGGGPPDDPGALPTPGRPP